MSELKAKSVYRLQTHYGRDWINIESFPTHLQAYQALAFFRAHQHPRREYRIKESQEVNRER